jgi:hypothetical protein
MSYVYVANISLRDRFDRVQLQLDNGSSAIIVQGSAYNLSATELERARRFVVMLDSTNVPVQPIVTERLPVVGTLSDGQVPIWDSSLAAFVPGTVSGGGGGGGGNTNTLIWDDATSNYVPAELRTDTSLPRNFNGPTDPSTIPSIVGPVFGDIWNPTTS